METHLAMKNKRDQDELFVCFQHDVADVHGWTGDNLMGENVIRNATTPKMVQVKLQIHI